MPNLLSSSPEEAIAMLRDIWQKTKTNRTAKLPAEERLQAEIMKAHQHVFDFEWIFNHPENRITDLEHPLFHIMIHFAIETQLQEKDPIEAVQFFESMQKMGLTEHEAIHMLGALLNNSVSKLRYANETVISRNYQSTLKRLKNEKPEKIAEMMAIDIADLLEEAPMPTDLFTFDTMDSATAGPQLDDIIDAIADGARPINLQSRSGNEAVLVSKDMLNVLSDIQTVLANAGRMGEENEFEASSTDFGKTTAADRDDADDQPLTLNKKFKDVLQFKITLKGAKPPIWRRIQVPADYTFWDLHCAIQDAMGWDDAHLHQFTVIDDRIGEEREFGVPEEDDGFGFGDFDLLEAAWSNRLRDCLSPSQPKAEYIYDFGDDWVHQIVLEKTLPREKGQAYPVCIQGKRACPPEDCGGVWGYRDLLKIIQNPKHKEYKNMMEWLDGSFDPAQFDAASVKFSDPRKRLKFLLS